MDLTFKVNAKDRESCSQGYAVTVLRFVIFNFFVICLLRGDGVNSV